MKKKLLSIIFMGVLIVGLTGCGSSSKNESNLTNSASDNNNSKVITCVQLQQNPNFHELSRGTRTIFDGNKIIDVVYFLKTTDNKSAEEYCNNEGKRLTGVFENVSYEIKDNNCDITFNISKMTDSELEELTFGKTSDTKTLINKMSYDDYYNYLSTNEYAFCNKGEKVEKKHPSAITGAYSGFIFASNGGTYDWHKVTMSFNDGNYVCSYSINNNNYKIVGSYTYDLDDGKLELNMDEKNSEGNTNLASSCYGTKRVYENIEGYNIEIVNTVSDNTDYQKGLKLNKE